MSRLIAIFLLLFNIGFSNLFAETSTSSAEAIKQQKLIIQNSIEDIKNAKSHFSCGDIGMITTIGGSDPNYIFFDEKSREFICIYGMSVRVSKTSVGEGGVYDCPPSKWEAEGCRKIYNDLLKSKNNATQK